jgi:hypothetical protein
MVDKALHVTIRYTVQGEPVMLGILKDLINKNKGVILTDNYTIFELEPDEELISAEFTKD